MESWQAECIRKNLSELLRSTQVTTFLTAPLLSNNILASDEVEKLNLTRNNQGNSDAAKILYDILPQRVSAYDSLVSALNSTNQSGAAKILETAREKQTIDDASKSTEGNNIIVKNSKGISDFNVSDVVETLSKSKVFSVLIKDWSKLSIRLNTEYTLTDRLAKQNLAGLIEPEELLLNLLREWKSRCREDATIEKLHSILTSCTFNDAARMLEQRYPSIVANVQ